MLRAVEKHTRKNLYFTNVRFLLHAIDKNVTYYFSFFISIFKWYHYVLCLSMFF